MAFFGKSELILLFCFSADDHHGVLVFVELDLCPSLQAGDKCIHYSMIIRALKSITGEQWQPAMWQQVELGAWPPRFHWWCSKVFFNIILARKVAVSRKFNLIFRCDSLSSCSEKTDGRRAKEKEVEVKKRLVQCARCDEKVCNADVFD